MKWLMDMVTVGALTAVVMVAACQPATDGAGCAVVMAPGEPLPEGRSAVRVGDTILAVDLGSCLTAR